jgi:hypothetical protein
LFHFDGTVLHITAHSTEKDADNDICDLLKSLLSRDPELPEPKIEVERCITAANPCGIWSGTKFGTAFCYKDNWAITAYHVVKHAQTNNVMVGAKTIDKGTGKYHFSGKCSSYASVRRFNSVLDVAFMFIDHPLAGQKVNVDDRLNIALKWDRELAPRIQNELRVFKNGTVTGRTYGRVVNDTDPRKFQVETRTHGPFAFLGDSGSVVMSEEGYVLGIVLGILGEGRSTGARAVVLRLEAFFDMAFTTNNE